MSEQSSLQAKLSLVKTYDDFFALCQVLRKEDERNLFASLFPIALSGAPDGVASMAALALIELEPKCLISCDEAIEKIANSKWDLSSREIPFYLVSQFGKWTVREAVLAFSARPGVDEQSKVLVDGVWYWACGPSVKLTENLFYWEWQEAIEGPNA